MEPTNCNFCRCSISRSLFLILVFEKFVSYVGATNPGQVLMWDGTKWQNLPSSYSGITLEEYQINVMLIYNNQLFVGGGFTYIFSYGNGNLSGVAMWDGQTWYGLSSNYLAPVSSVNAMTVYQSQLFMAVSYATLERPCHPSQIIGVPISAFSVSYYPPTPSPTPSPTPQPTPHTLIFCRN